MKNPTSGQLNRNNCQTIDYKNDNVDEKIVEYCHKGLDIYFDNVGGEILTTCLNNLAFNARIVLCGSISEYMPDGLAKLYEGKNQGVALCRVRNDNEFQF